jgi:hypothetical protein
VPPTEQSSVYQTVRCSSGLTGCSRVQPGTLGYNSPDGPCGAPDSPVITQPTTTCHVSCSQRSDEAPDSLVPPTGQSGARRKRKVTNQGSFYRCIVQCPVHPQTGKAKSLQMKLQWLLGLLGYKRTPYAPWSST